MDKLNIHNEMMQFDRKNREFYDELTDEEKKKFSTYLMLKWGPNIPDDDSEMAGYYVIAVNENVNKHFFDINKHPKLQWLSCTTVNPVKRTFKHYWITPPKKEGTGRNKVRKQIMELMPALKTDEVDLLLSINDDEEINQWLVTHGITDKEIKALYKK